VTEIEMLRAAVADLTRRVGELEVRKSAGRVAKAKPDGPKGPGGRPVNPNAMHRLIARLLAAGGNEPMTARAICAAMSRDTVKDRHLVRQVFYHQKHRDLFEKVETRDAHVKYRLTAGAYERLKTEAAATEPTEAISEPN